MNNAITINISLPQSMYLDIKSFAKNQRYASISEVIREGVRRILYKGLTENGFTPEFEERVLRAANDPNERYVEWDGKTPFTEFMLSHPPA